MQCPGLLEEGVVWSAAAVEWEEWRRRRFWRLGSRRRGSACRKITEERHHLLTLRHERCELPTHHLCARSGPEQLALCALRILQPLQECTEGGAGQQSTGVNPGIHMSDHVAKCGRNCLLLRYELLRVVKLIRFGEPAREQGAGGSGPSAAFPSQHLYVARTLYWRRWRAPQACDRLR